MAEVSKKPNKIPADIVEKFIVQQRFLMDGIREGIRMGDDGMEDFINDQFDEIQKHINLFIEENLVEKDITDKIILKTYQENSVEEKFQIYFIRLIKELEVEELQRLYNSENQRDLSHYLENKCFESKSSLSKMMEKEYFFSAIRIIEEVIQQFAQPIIKNHTQTKLF